MILETFTRVFVATDALDTTCAFYKALLGGEQTMRFAYPESPPALVLLANHLLRGTKAP